MDLSSSSIARCSKLFKRKAAAFLLPFRAFATRIFSPAASPESLAGEDDAAACDLVNTSPSSRPRPSSAKRMVSPLKGLLRMKLSCHSQNRERDLGLTTKSGFRSSPFDVSLGSGSVGLGLLLANGLWPNQPDTQYRVDNNNNSIIIYS